MELEVERVSRGDSKKQEGWRHTRMTDHRHKSLWTCTGQVRGASRGGQNRLIWCCGMTRQSNDRGGKVPRTNGQTVATAAPGPRANGCCCCCCQGAMRKQLPQLPRTNGQTAATACTARSILSSWGCFYTRCSMPWSLLNQDSHLLPIEGASFSIVRVHKPPCHSIPHE